MKYGTWNVATCDPAALLAMVRAGYSPLTAQCLCARGYDTPQKARQLLQADAPLIDPFEMKEMDRAVKVIRQGLKEKKKIAVFGDYVVDGITATCLLVDYLRSEGADCIFHIPGRLEEGYGLNEMAIEQLAGEGIQMIITVDCGITAVREAQLCREKGIRLVITDHHECKETLPDADAVVDPHRPDRSYPHTDLCGVGIAFKLAAALCGDQEAIARRYADLFCLGTIADVMPLVGENRHLVTRGLKAMGKQGRLGLRVLAEECGCGAQPITASTVGYVLSPRINAAGRMEHAELAVQLFLTKDPARATELAQTLCRLNRERQLTEQEIYKEATAMLRGKAAQQSAIVLAGEQWHQGVVGIVASRLSEEYGKPAFLICMTGDNGKASSRSYGGFNLFAALNEMSDLLVGYGGHELAAGFTIRREHIDEFRSRICSRVSQFCAAGESSDALSVDCEPRGKDLTLENVEALEQLEPCGTGCPKPLFCLSEVTILQLSTVGGGKHLRLRLATRDGVQLQAIWFCCGSAAKKLRVGERVDVAFHLQINEFRGLRSVQLSLVDLHILEAEELYRSFREGLSLSRHQRSLLAPTRQDVVQLFTYIRSGLPADGQLRCSPQELEQGLCRSCPEYSLRRVRLCLDILRELGVVQLKLEGSSLCLSLPADVHNPLENSCLYQALRGD